MFTLCEYGFCEIYLAGFLVTKIIHWKRWCWGYHTIYFLVIFNNVFLCVQNMSAPFTYIDSKSSLISDYNIGKPWQVWSIVSQAERSWVRIRDFTSEFSKFVWKIHFDPFDEGKHCEEICPHWASLNPLLGGDPCLAVEHIHLTSWCW